MSVDKKFLDNLLPLLEENGFTTEVTNKKIIIRRNESNTECHLILDELNVMATDGVYITDRWRMYTRVATPAEGLEDLVNLGHWNAYASISPVILDDEGLAVVSKITSYRDKNGVDYIDIRHINVAIWLSFGLANFLENGYPNAMRFLRFGISPDITPSLLGVPDDDANNPTTFSDAEFKEVEMRLREMGLVSFSGDKGISVEFPWDPDSSSVLLSDKRTALLRIQNDMRHPLLGNGLLVTLQLPFFLDNQRLAKVVNEINLWEMGTIDMPPLLGSWCIEPKSSAPAFVLFIPAIFSSLVNIQTVVAWMLFRHKAVMTHMKQLGLDI